MSESATLNPLRESLEILWRRKLALIIVTVLTLLGAVFAVLRMPPTFVAGSTLLVKFGREFIHRPVVGNSAETRSFSLEEIVNSEIEILRSRDLAEKVVSEIGAEMMYPEIFQEEPDVAIATEKSVATLRDKISASGVLDSSVIRIRIEHVDPRIAARATNLLVDRFLEKHLEIFRESRSEFIDAQLTKHLELLTESENALEAFKRENRLTSLEAQRDLLLAQRVQFDTTLRTTDFRLSELEEKLKGLNGDPDQGQSRTERASPEARAFLLNRRRELQERMVEVEHLVTDLEARLETLESHPTEPDGQLPAGVDSPRAGAYEDARVRLLDLQLRRAALLKDYEPGSRTVKAVAREIELVEKFLVEAETAIEREFSARVLDDLATQSAKKARLQAGLDEIDRAMTSLDVQEVLEEQGDLEARRAKIAEEITRLGEEVHELDTHEKTLRKLTRAVTIHEQSYQSSLARAEEARISQDLDERKQINIRVIERAVPPIAPSGMPKKMKLLVAGFSAMIAGVAAAFFVELTRG
jgi:uncharacterized protein involved in exopolysaccharide biosynthesis